MRVTLVQPPQGARFGFTKVLLVEPVGLECVGAALKLHEHEVHLLDLRLDPPAVLWEHLRTVRPQAVGISCGFTTDVYSALQTARQVKEAPARDHGVLRRSPCLPYPRGFPLSRLAGGRGGNRRGRVDSP
ncbi:MAG: hypothetical protein KatS3mg131_1499 [Candidatus Tectimicrobiota bacterium]|nr:MAG: hypothetical protein KatS3mg131_1499 [Candidatus Tectomicrobia bacterium]